MDPAKPDVREQAKELAEILAITYESIPYGGRNPAISRAALRLTDALAAAYAEGRKDGLEQAADYVNREWRHNAGSWDIECAIRALASPIAQQATKREKGQ